MNDSSSTDNNFWIAIAAMVLVLVAWPYVEKKINPRPNAPATSSAAPVPGAPATPEIGRAHV